jgi:hypothetical protein
MLSIACCLWNLRVPLLLNDHIWVASIVTVLSSISWSVISACWVMLSLLLLNDHQWSWWFSLLSAVISWVEAFISNWLIEWRFPWYFIEWLRHILRHTKSFVSKGVHWEATNVAWLLNWLLLLALRFLQLHLIMLLTLYLMNVDVSPRQWIIRWHFSLDRWIWLFGKGI